MRPAPVADNSAAPVVPNVKVRMEAQHSDSLRGLFEKALTSNIYILCWNLLKDLIISIILVSFCRIYCFPTVLSFILPFPLPFSLFHLFNSFLFLSHIYSLLLFAGFLIVRMSFYLIFLFLYLTLLFLSVFVLPSSVILTAVSPFPV